MVIQRLSHLIYNELWNITQLAYKLNKENIIENATKNLRTPFLHANGPRSATRMHREKIANHPITLERQTADAIHSLTLFGNNKEISIQHEGNDYRLSITRQGKLILTK